MITPLGQRQLLQTATVELLRQAQEGAALVQRDQARTQAFRSHLEATALDVSDVATVDPLSLEGQGGQRRPPARPSPPSETSEAEVETPAADAQSHVDVLA